MEFTTEKSGSDLIIHVKGAVVGIETLSLTKHIEAYGDSDYSKIIIDLNGVTHIDSHGLGGLTYSDILLKKRGKKMIIIIKNDLIKGLISRCNLDKVLTVQDTY